MTNPDFLKVAYVLGAEQALEQAGHTMTPLEKQALLSRMMPGSSWNQLRKGIRGSADDVADAASSAPMQTRTVADNAAERNFFGAADEVAPTSKAAPDAPPQTSGAPAPTPADDPGMMERMRNWMSQGNNGMYAAGGLAAGGAGLGALGGYAAAPDPTLGNAWNHYTGG